MPLTIADAFGDFLFSDANQPAQQTLYAPQHLLQSFYMFPTTPDEVASVIDNLEITST